MTESFDHAAVSWNAWGCRHVSELELLGAPAALSARSAWRSPRWELASAELSVQCAQPGLDEVASVARWALEAPDADQWYANGRRNRSSRCAGYRGRSQAWA